MAELSGHVSALTGLARGLSTAATAPLTGAAALVFGLRRATAVRRSLQVAALAETPPEAARPAITGPAAPAAGLEAAARRRSARTAGRP